MKDIIINKPHFTQVMEVWEPKWNNDSLVGNYDERVALLHKGKVYHGSSKYIIVQFTKSKSLAGLRFCISRDDAKRHVTGTNGKSAMLEIPMSHFSSYTTVPEIKETVNELWPR